MGFAALYPSYELAQRGVELRLRPEDKATLTIAAPMEQLHLTEVTYTSRTEHEPGG
jgi:hypothetical protein